MNAETSIKEPPGFKTLFHEKRCTNCEHKQSAVLIGSFCEKHKRYYVSSDNVCDDWEKEFSKKKEYVGRPITQEELKELINEER